MSANSQSGCYDFSKLVRLNDTIPCQYNNSVTSFQLEFITPLPSFEMSLTAEKGVIGL